MALPIKRARKIVPFYPDQAVAVEIETAEKAVAEAKKSAGDRLASKAVREAEKALDDITSAAQATVLEIELEALSRKRFAEIEESHPPREGDKVDEAFSINWGTFLAEALPESIRSIRYRASGEPVEVTADEWREALDEISDAQYQALGFAILRLNRDQANPF